MGVGVVARMNVFVFSHPPPSLTLPQSKSDISDFDQFKMPNSGKPELGGGGNRLSKPRTPNQQQRNML